MAVALDSKDVLIVGDGAVAATCSHALVLQGGGRFRLAGVVAPGELLDFLRRPAERLPHRVVVALDDRRGQLPVAQLVALRFDGVRVQDASAFLEDVAGKVPVRSVRPADLVFSHGFRSSRWTWRVKFALEWALALLLLVASAPLMALAAIAILLESGRPVLFRQVRVGQGGRTFRIAKLRTMRQDAEKGGARFASLTDDRVTRVGRFLRRTRIDELPQLLNILRGEMTLIGPRPERPEFVAGFLELTPFFVYRHSVRPGVTGWAQVALGYTDDADGALEKLSYDLYYIKHHSLLFDLRILLMTAATVFRREGR